MKTFFKWCWIPAIGLLLLTALILLLVWRPPAEDPEDFIITQTYYVDSTVADDDERLNNAFVNNSVNNFFVQGDQLAGQLYLESKTTKPHRRTFYEQYRKRRDIFVTEPLELPRLLRVTTECHEFDGKNNTERVFAVGEELTYLGLYTVGDRYYYRLGEDSFLPAGCAVRLCQRTPFEGTLTHPYTVDINQVQYLQFTEQGDYIYLYFTTDNEFISLFLEGLPAGSSWELYDRTYRKLAARYCGGGGEEIYYRAPSASRFLLRINAADAARVEMTFHRDQNEWKQNMSPVDVERNYSGVFDYYGDEDFFLLTDEMSRDIGGLVMELKGVDARLQVIAYDRNKKMIGRYTREKGAEEEIVLYGLEDVYALSLRTVDGSLTEAAYQVRFFYQDVDLLGLETYGFKLSSPIQTGKDGENYYTAVCKGLTGKRIADVQTLGKAQVDIRLTTAAGATYVVREGQDLPLHVGKNVVTVTITNPSDQRVITICITDAASYDLGYVFVTAGSTPLRQQAITTGSTMGTLYKGDKVLSTGVRQNGFLKVELVDGSGKSGWVWAGDLFTDYRECSMPASYASAIKRLQKNHPNWKFTFVRVDKTLEAAVATEKNNHPIITDGHWRTPTTDEVRYYMDPRNFLNEEDIFMFEKQTYQEGSYSLAGIRAVWKEREGALAGSDYYARCFLEAGKSAGLSPYFIAARAAIESGYGTSALSKGTSSGYEGYYNFYGINAVDSNPKKGAVYAKEHNWYTQRIAIVEGAVWIKDQYISVLQYTPYFIKYSFVPGRGWHQYMTDVAAPLADAERCYAAHKAGGTLNSAIEFVIPVYD